MYFYMFECICLSLSNKRDYYTKKRHILATFFPTINYIISDVFIFENTSVISGNYTEYFSLNHIQRCGIGIYWSISQKLNRLLTDRRPTIISPQNTIGSYREPSIWPTKFSPQISIGNYREPFRRNFRQMSF